METLRLVQNFIAAVHVLLELVNNGRYLTTPAAASVARIQSAACLFAREQHNRPRTFSQR